MTPLEELLIKWHDQSLTPEEWTELNGWLQTAEGRARLQRDFAFDAGLLEALLAGQARAEVRAQAREFETAEVRDPELFVGWFRRVGRAFAGATHGWPRKLAWLLGASLVFGCWMFLVQTKTEPLARVESGTRNLSVRRGGKPVLTPASGLVVNSGDLIQTSGSGRATVAYLSEPTRIEMQAGTRLRLEQTNSMKRLELTQGTITAVVAPQPRGRPMLVVTPHAEAIVMGTEFFLAVTAASSRLEVLDGALQFVNREDGKSVMVAGGYFAIAAKGVEFAARSLLPEPWHSQDIGEVGLTGAARLEGSRCLAKGAGRNTCLTKDQFHFVYQLLDGDGEIIARVVNLEMTNPGGKAGLVIRESLKTSARHAFVFLRSDGRVEFEHRPMIESKTDRVGREAAPFWLRLTRKGEVIAAFLSRDGTTWTRAGSERIKMGERIYVGLGVTSWDNASLATSVFDNVRVLASTR